MSRNLKGGTRLGPSFGVISDLLVALLKNVSFLFPQRFMEQVFPNLRGRTYSRGAPGIDVEAIQVETQCSWI